MTEDRSKFTHQLEAAVEKFRAACLVVDDPLEPIGEGGWNTHQLAAHTRDVDKVVYGMRIHRTAEEEKPEFKDFDADAWMATNYNADEPLASILDELSASVKQTTSILQALPQSAWNRESRHEAYGDVCTLQIWVERGLAHIEEHLVTLQKAA